MPPRKITKKPTARTTKPVKHAPRKIGRPKAAPVSVPEPEEPVKRTPHKRTVVDDPQIGALTPEEFESIASEALGGWGWQRTWGHGTGMAQSSITRYLRGIIPIPKTVALILEMLMTLRNNGLPLPDAFSRLDTTKKPKKEAKTDA